LKNFIRKPDERRTVVKNKKLSRHQKDVLLVKASTQFGDRALYSIEQRTQGLALYAYADSKQDAEVLRKTIPLRWNKLFTVVIYIDLPDEGDDEA